MKTLTIRVQEEIYEQLLEAAGNDGVEAFVNASVRLGLEKREMEKTYDAMARDTERENAALSWSEALLPDISDETW